MIKGKLNVLTLFVLLLSFVYGMEVQAQIEVVPLEEEDKVFYFDSLSPQETSMAGERKIPDSILKKMQSDEAFWYANAQIQKSSAAEKERTLSLSWLEADWVRSALWLLIIGLFAAVMVWYLSTLNVRLFRKASTSILSPEVDGHREDIFSISYKAEIKKAIDASNYTLAVRLYYLQSLTLLSKKHFIQFQQDRTNSEYVIQLFNTPYYKDFYKLTRHFEYAWYGKFEMAQPVFKRVQKDFETFQQKLTA